MQRKPTTELKVLLSAIPAQYFNKTPEHPVPEQLREVHRTMANAAIRYGFSSFEVLENCVVMQAATDSINLRVYGRPELGYRAMIDIAAVSNEYSKSWPSDDRLPENIETSIEHVYQPLSVGSVWHKNITAALQELNKEIVLARMAEKKEAGEQNAG